MWVSAEEVWRAMKDESSLCLLPAPGYWDGENQVSSPWPGSGTFRRALGLDGAALPGAWSELPMAATIVKHIGVGCSLGELSLGTDL